MLRIKFVPYERIKEEKFKKILKDLAENTIILVDAKLDAKEEAALIAETMRNVSEKFAGIELSFIDINGKKKQGHYGKLKGAGACSGDCFRAFSLRSPLVPISS